MPVRLSMCVCVCVCHLFGTNNSPMLCFAEKWSISAFLSGSEVCACPCLRCPGYESWWSGAFYFVALTGRSVYIAYPMRSMRGNSVPCVEWWVRIPSGPHHVPLSTYGVGISQCDLIAMSIGGVGLYMLLRLLTWNWYWFIDFIALPLWTPSQFMLFWYHCIQC